MAQLSIEPAKVMGMREPKQLHCREEPVSHARSVARKYARAIPARVCKLAAYGMVTLGLLLGYTSSARGQFGPELMDDAVYDLTGLIGLTYLFGAGSWGQPSSSGPTGTVLVCDPSTGTTQRALVGPATANGRTTAIKLSIGPDGNPVINAAASLTMDYNSPYHGFLASLSGDLTNLENASVKLVDLGDLGGNTSFATGLSIDGSVVVGASYLDPDGNTEHAFLWTGTNGMVDLGSSSGPGGFSRAFGVSGDGSIVVGEKGDSPFSGTNAFVWTANSGFQDLGVGSAYAVTADGSTVVGQANYATAFLWTQASGMQDLGSLPGYSNSVATRVSDDGRVVVGFAAPRLIGYSDPLGFDYDIDCLPFVWTAATGMQDLNQILANAGVDLTGITLYAITGITQDGQYVCGNCRTRQNDPSNPEDTKSFIAQLPQ